MSKPYPADVLNQMNAAIASWQAIDPTLKFGDISLEMMQSANEISIHSGASDGT